MIYHDIIMEIMMMVVMEILLALLPQWQSCVRVQRHQWPQPLRQQRPHPERCWWRIRCCSCGSERLVPDLPGDSGQTEIGVRVRSAKCCRYVRLKFGDSPQSSAANLWNRTWFSGNCLLTSVQGGMKKSWHSKFLSPSSPLQVLLGLILPEHVQHQHLAQRPRCRGRRQQRQRQGDSWISPRFSIIVTLSPTDWFMMFLGKCWNPGTSGTGVESQIYRRVSRKITGKPEF